MKTQQLIENAALLIKADQRLGGKLASYLVVDSAIANHDAHVWEVDDGDAWIIYADHICQSVKVKRSDLRPAINSQLAQLAEDAVDGWKRPCLLDIVRTVDEAAEDTLLASPPTSAVKWERAYARLDEVYSQRIT